MTEISPEVFINKEFNNKLPQKVGKLSSLLVGLATFVSSCSPDQNETLKTAPVNAMPNTGPSFITSTPETFKDINSPTPVKIVVESKKSSPSEIRITKPTTANPSTQPKTEVIIKTPTAKPDKIVVVDSNPKAGLTTNNTAPEKTPIKQQLDPELRRWTETQWKDNQTVPLREWWNDMVQRGLIKMDSLAQRYAGDQINGIINGFDMVPKPKNYYEKQLAFAGNCQSELQKISEQGQGHITISSEVYPLIPGGNDCQVFEKAQK